MDTERLTRLTEWLPASDASERLGVTQKTVYERARLGKLNSKTVNGILLFEVECLRSSHEGEPASNVADTSFNEASNATFNGGDGALDPTDVIKHLQQENQQLLDVVEQTQGENRRLMELTEQLQGELRSTRDKLSDERERTDSIIMQQARTIDSLTAEVRQLRALPIRRPWWERLFLRR